SNRDPHTNGQVVVYTSTRSGESDVYYQPISGGPATQIAIPGDQRSPRISGNLIAFESQVQGSPWPEYDIFVYDISTGSLYQVTNTAVDEFLAGITVCNGFGRIGYTAAGSDFDAYAFTFPLPLTSPNQQINDLMALVVSFKLSKSLESSLITKL